MLDENEHSSVAVFDVVANKVKRDSGPFASIMRSMVFLFLLAGALSGCTDVPEEPAGPDRLLVRVFLEDGDAVIRFAAVTGTDVHPFDGDVDIILWPEEQTSWLPRAWNLNVQQGDFVDAVLPYMEVAGRVNDARPGDLVLVEAEATLVDGTVLEGRYVTTF